MESITKKLSFYITLDNKEVIGLDSFSQEVKELFRMGTDKVQTSRGTYQKIKDSGRVLSRDEARRLLRWGKWESPHPVPIRELEYILS